VLVVSDTGPGIDPEFTKRIFEPFYSTKAGGMGLGLSICTSIIEACGGSITARRKPGGGAEFRIALPLADDQTVPDPQSCPDTEMKVTGMA
jgi:two-component system, LuxR family, sensor kinase FixL